MKYKKTTKTLLTWLPSLILAIIFIQNGLEKIFYVNEMDKIVKNSTIIIIVGILVLVATALFLYNKTIILGTTILALYMTCIVFIHIYKGKQFEVTVIIVIAIIFAAYLRKPTFFLIKKE